MPRTADARVYVYGVLSGSDQARVSVGGVEDAEVRTVEHAGLAALVSTLDADALAAAREVRAHWRVLEEASKGATVLPVRFGTVMEGDRAVRERLLEPNAGRLTDLLGELAGRVQLNVKGDYDEERLLREVVRASPAVAALRERVRELSEAAGYYDRIRLGELVAAEVARRRERDAAVALERLQPLAVTARGCLHPGRRVQPGLPRGGRRGGHIQRSRGAAAGGARRARRAPVRGSASAVQLRRDRPRRGGGGVGLITGLLTLPLAPVRGTVWLAERIQEQAEEELYDESAIRAGLLEIEAARQTGELDEHELAEAEDALIERLMAIRGFAGEESYGRIG